VTTLNSIGYTRKKEKEGETVDIFLVFLKND